MAERREVSAYELWREAGGGTPEYSAERYRDLLLKWGLLVPLESGEKAEPLPCGWPGKPTGDVEED